MEKIKKIIEESVEVLFTKNQTINLFMVIFGIIFGFSCCIGTILNLFKGRKKNGRL